MLSENPLLDSLFQKARSQTFSKSEVIQTSSDSEFIHLLSKGYVKRYMITNSGTISVQGVYGKGQLFPLTLVFKILFNQVLYVGRENYYYEAMSDVKIKKISSRELKTAVAGNPLLYRELLKSAGTRLLANIQRLENTGLTGAKHRLAHQLAFYARQFGKKSKEGIVIPIKLKHHDLAADLDLTRETVSHNMKELKDSGLVKTSGLIKIPSIEKLEKLADS